MPFKAQVRTSPTILIEVTGDNQKDLFSAIAGAMEVFSEKECGLCGGTSLRLVHRKSGLKGEFDYHECACNGCGARLTYSQSGDKVSLFPNRKLMPNGKPGNPKKKEGEYGKHNGFTKYRGDATEEE